MTVTPVLFMTVAAMSHTAHVPVAHIVVALHGRAAVTVLSREDNTSKAKNHQGYYGK